LAKSIHRSFNKNSPYKNGKGDLVKEVSDACKQQGLRLALSFSWIETARLWSASYINYYRNQLKELFTQYGKVSEMWFDVLMVAMVIMEEQMNKKDHASLTMIGQIHLPW
jgi:alpha-L-fucosidase